ncbi:sigma-70 family RNA polymerase sigma factor [Ruminococcus sp.]|uniref:RNA polymerase sigma factor n=1 Tax=Ruminococcus sp. TaxID=41978 RepID=UPI0025D70005|nr:sigma-70 family RNA polymerase sigma factor [Ruminococcus sp.]MCR4637912.1 sigma-70 family RNA polymerase sigma factor [Ruminococcus sp.]
MNDASIIELFFKRDERAIAELKHKYERLCFYIAGNILSSPEDIEECINSAYYEAWNKIPPDSPADLKSYLCHMVKNKALDRYKYNSAEKRSSDFAVSLDELSDCIPDYREDNGEEKALAEAISRFLRTQDELHRKVFVRRYWYGDSIARISEYYGIKERTAATYLFRVRRKLKDYLKKEGYYNG